MNPSNTVNAEAPVEVSPPVNDGGRRRVCFIAHFTSGGSIISMKTLASHLDRERFEPVALFHFDNAPEMATELRDLGVAVHTLMPGGSSPGGKAPKTRDTEAWLAAGAFRRRLLPSYHLYRALRMHYRRERRLRAPMAQFLREHRIDVAHCNTGLRMHVPDLMELRRARVPTVCHVRGFQQLTGLERWAGRDVRRFIYISEAIRQSYLKQGIDSSRGEVVHNVTTLEPPLPVEERRALRAEFGWDDSHFVALNAGRLVDWKGHDVFIDAAHAALSRIPQLRCLIVGAPDDSGSSRAFADGLHRQVEERGVEEQVRFTGHRHDVLKLMAAADAVVHTATTPEPFGRVIIEGMGAGVPVIAARDGGVLEIVSEDENGVTTPPGDVGALADMFCALATDSDRCRRLGDAGRRHVEQNFTIEAQVERVQRIYDSVVAQREHAPA